MAASQGEIRSAPALGSEARIRPEEARSAVSKPALSYVEGGRWRLSTDC
jgi:hypothetical protein